ncbi:MAG: ATP-binding cassette domain-containing protein, partial [Nocardioides sp.]
MGAELTVRDVRLSRGGREVLAVDHLTVKPSEHVFVLGPNGAGKTTLLRLLAAVDQPDRGAVEVDGVSIRRIGLAERRRIGYVTQRPALLGTTVLRNVELPLRWRKVPRVRRRAQAHAALDRLRVGHLADRPALALSGGEQQRVNLARSLACDPDVLLLDEPAAGLDAEARAIFYADLEYALSDRAVTT